MEQSQELIGILQAISIVAKSLAAKLVQIEKEVEAYEAAKCCHKPMNPLPSNPSFRGVVS